MQEPFEDREADLRDVIDYAQKWLGYEPRVRDGEEGVVVLENACLRDRVAVAQTPAGRWFYADIRHYSPRGRNEPAERALLRLRDCIGRSPSKGRLSEFARRVEGLKRGRGVLGTSREVRGPDPRT